MKAKLAPHSGQDSLAGSVGQPSGSLTDRVQLRIG
jgi:hypothetical protein